MNFSKLICNILVLLFISGILFGQNHRISNAPQTFSYYLSHSNNDPSISQAEQFARYDLIILDMEIQHLNPLLMQQIRAINPDIKILAYMTCQEINHDLPQNDQILRNQLYSGIQPQWWLMDSNQNHVVFWVNTWMLNCSTSCPIINNQRWTDYYAAFISQNILSQDCWDGFFIDNCWNSVSWLNIPDSMMIDADNNQIPDDPQILDQNWRLGMESLISHLRAMNPDKIIMGNGGYDFSNILDGIMTEGWNYDSNWEFSFSWADLVNHIQSIDQQSPTDFIHLVMAMQRDSVFSNFQHFRLTLTTALLGNTWYSIDKGPLDHSDLWYYDEYNVDLGSPLQKADFFNDNLQNYIENGDFSNGWTNWTYENHLNSSNFPQIIYESENPLLFWNITDSDPQNSWKMQVIYPSLTTLSWTDNHYYAIRLRAKSNVNRSIDLIIQKNSGDFNWLTSKLYQANLTPDWNDLTIYLKAYYPNDVTNPLPGSEIRFAIAMGAMPGHVYLDNIEIYEVTEAVFYRIYQNGLVICNPTDSEKMISLDNVFYHINGTQDPLINNGQSVQNFAISGRDGVILLSSPPVAENDVCLSPDDLTLYPNPFRQMLHIRSSDNSPNHYSLTIYNIKGQLIREFNETSADNKTHIWDLKNEQGKPVSSGIYLFLLKSKNKTLIKKGVLIK